MNPSSSWRLARHLRTPLLAVAVAALMQPAFAQPAPLALDQAVQTATARSRLVTAADAQTRAAREMAVAAGRLPDPVLKLSLTNLPVDGPDRFSTTSDFMTMRSVGLMQEITRGDKRAARTQRAEREVEATRLARQLTIAELQRDTALAWLERSFQESVGELLLAQIAQAELQAQAAQTLYATAKGTQADVFAARGQVELLRDRLAQTERQIAVATTQLARWVGADALVAIAPRPVLTLPAWTQGDLTPHLSEHPMIAAIAQQEALADSDAALARAAQQADWSVEVMYSQRGSAYSNMMSVYLTVPLQWDAANRQDRELSARQAGVAQARARLEDAARAHDAEVRAMLQEWASDDARLRRFDTALLPLAEQRSAAALTAYRGGSGALTAVLEARRNELDLRTDRARLELERARLWAQLNYLQPAPETAP